MSQEIEPLVKAAECAQAIEATEDPIQRETLTHLRNLWITLANESHHMSAPELAEQIAALALIHAGLMPPAAQ